MCLLVLTSLFSQSFPSAKYRGDVDRLVDEMSYLREEFRVDEGVQAVSEDVKDIYEKLVYDETVSRGYIVILIRT